MSDFLLYLCWQPVWSGLKVTPVVFIRFYDANGRIRLETTMAALKAGIIVGPCLPRQACLIPLTWNDVTYEGRDCVVVILFIRSSCIPAHLKIADLKRQRKRRGCRASEMFLHQRPFVGTDPGAPPIRR